MAHADLVYHLVARVIPVPPTNETLHNFVEQMGLVELLLLLIIFVGAVGGFVILLFSQLDHEEEWVRHTSIV